MDRDTPAAIFAGRTPWPARALRAWPWRFTIQNPADHVDNDP